MTLFSDQTLAKLFLLATTALALNTSYALAEDGKFAIHKFEVQGNTLLPTSNVAAVVNAFRGESKEFGDIQKALEALELAYRKAGFGAVQVTAPEQEITSGIVTLQVTEVPITKVSVLGNQQFSTTNIRQSLPSLQEGMSINTLDLSRDIQIANENPARKLAANLAVGETENTLDAAITVTEDKPKRFYFSLDNTGNRDSGRLRLSASYQDANLWDLGHTLNVSYITSPDKPANAKLDVYALGYRLPLPQQRAIFDFLYAYSDAAAPVSALGQTLAGKGSIYSTKWTSYLPRLGEYSSRFGFGFDNKTYRTNAALHDTEFQLASAFYGGQLDSPGRLLDYQVGYVYNLGPDGDDFYSEAAGGRPSKRNFSALRLQGSFMQILPKDWMFRWAVSAQDSQGVVIPGAEQLSLAGMSSVRGFLERSVTVDSGMVNNLEIYTPELSAKVGVPGSFRLLAFLDIGQGTNNHMATEQHRTRIASSGFGVRYNIDKSLSLRADAARMGHIRPLGINNDASGLDRSGQGDWRGHFSLTYSY